MLRGINSNSIDLIYLDPPFNKGKAFHAPIGTSAEGASFHDIWSPDEVKDEWHNQVNDRFPELYKYLDAVGNIGSRSAKYYLIYMAVRLIEMRRILKDDGSLYLHCDPTVSHYLKLLMDTIFGHEMFSSEISWKRTSAHNDSLTFGNVRDVILMYGNSNVNVDAIREPLKGKTIEKDYKYEDEQRGLYAIDNLTGPKTSDGLSGKPWKDINPGDVGRCWSVPLKGEYAKWIEENIIPSYRSIKTPQGRLDALDESGLIHWPEKKGGMPRLKRYLQASTGQVLSNLWDDIPPVSARSKEYTGYPTQKPLRLLERIIKASSNTGEIVLDPFCGCATACIAAEKLERKWIGIDVSEKAYGLMIERLEKEVPSDMFRKPIFRKDRPVRADIEYKKAPTREDKKYLYGHQNGTCAACKTKFDIQHLEIDHIVPRSQGGGHEQENLQLLCSNCNRKKGDRPMEYLMARLRAA